MSWWRDLFRKTNQNPFALPGDQFPDEMKRRIRPPSRSRKLTAQERADDFARYIRERQHADSVRWTFDRKRVESIGCTHYIWRGTDEDSCIDCRRNNGKRFRYDSPPKSGHPGDGHLCGGEPCRCYAEPVIPS